VAFSPKTPPPAAGRAEFARQALEEAMDRRREAERLADRQRRRAAALRGREQLSAAEPGIAALRGELGAAQRAAEVAPALTAADDAATASRQARVKRERTLDALRTVLPDGELGPGGLRAAAQARRERIGQLEALRSVADQAAAEAGLADRSRATATSLSGDIGGCGERLGTLAHGRESATAACERARAAAAELPAATAGASRHRRAAQDAAALAKARADADRERAAYETATKQAVLLGEEALRVRRARIDGMRAELAATLTDDMPCPVCGSLDHPELCELRGERVTREQEETATTAADAASLAKEQAGGRVTAADTRTSTLVRQLAEAGFAEWANQTGFAGWDDADLAALRTQAKRLDEAARALEQEAAELDATAATLTTRQAEYDSLAEQIADTQTRQAELTQQRDAELDKAVAADDRAAECLRTLQHELDGAPDLNVALKAARRAADALTAAADAADDDARAAEVVSRAGEAVAIAAEQAGFADVAAVRAALREPGWRTAADTRIREHEGAVAAVATQLADPELDVPLEPPANVDDEVRAAGQAGLRHEAAVADLARAQRKADQLSVLVPQLGVLLDEIAPLAERAAEIQQLADLAAGLGSNTLRMTLSSFVLAARLEEVAAAASQRLLRMTAGRYSLVHTDSRRGGGKSGLGLLACDAWTGTDRDTSTLSGGETFMASLALALGLADVVTEEAGGTRIEALFVDEGFGSLDEETLEEVMNVLDGLREGGRCVGIVSHVSELRQRIPAQIRVRKSHSGSTVSVQSGAAA
jgi:DNA repair protein SbcC/Rad50